MLALLFLFFIGKAFYQLAGTHGKNRWLFAILGIASYYAGTVIAGFGFGFYIPFMPESALANLSETVIGLIAIPFGLLACWGFYKILARAWSTGEQGSNSDTLDGGFSSRY